MRKPRDLECNSPIPVGPWTQYRHQRRSSRLGGESRFQSEPRRTVIGWQLSAPRRSSSLGGGQASLLGAKIRNDLLAEEANGVAHLLMPRRADRAQQEHFLDAKRLVNFEKADAFRRCGT